MARLKINVTWHPEWAIPSYNIDGQYPDRLSNCTEFNHSVPFDLDPFAKVLRNLTRIRERNPGITVTW